MNAKKFSTALLIALVVSGLCTWLLGRRMETKTTQHVPDKRYVAASKTLQAGEVLKQGDLEFVNWPATNPIADTYTKIEDIIGRSALYPVGKGQPITEQALSAPGSGIGLAAKIPPGMRAIALRSDEVMGVAGFLFPGSHLDVLVTYKSDTSTEPTTLTVLQNAEVLAAGQKIQPDPEGKPVTATVVTLLLTPEDAQRAVMASTQGSIHFVLRGGSDKEQVHEYPLALSQLSGARATGPQQQSNITRRVAARKAVPEPQPIVVETIAGGKQTSDAFPGGR